jgi:hypothetical protein
MDLQLLRQKLVNNLSNENINTGVSVVFKTKLESKCQKGTIFEISLETPVFIFSLWRLFAKLLT